MLNTTRTAEPRLAADGGRRDREPPRLKPDVRQQEAMSTLPISEQFFEQLCAGCGVVCQRVPTASVRTPDFRIWLGATEVFCEIKQIDPNAEDLAELMEVSSGQAAGRYVPDRLRRKLKDVSAQLKAAARDRYPTLLVVYDNTPFKVYTGHADVIQAMFGHESVRVSFSKSASEPAVISEPFFGGDRRFTANHNTSVSVLGILDGGPSSPRTLRIYHNPYASVVLKPELLDVFQCDQRLLPGTTSISL